MSAKTALVVINEAIADVKTTADAAYSASNPPPVASVVFTAAYNAASGDHTAINADLNDGKCVLFLNSTSSPHVNETYTDTVFASPTDGDTFRVGNVSSTANHLNTITLNDGTADVAIIAPGEFVRLVWSDANTLWLKVQGV